MTKQLLLAGRYELRERLGKGGMGEVWRGFDTVLHREVAIKIVDLSAGEDAATAERFQREALATASLSHPNVVTVFDAGIDGSNAYLVMELLAGPTMSALLAARGVLPTDQVTDYARQTAAALEAAHRVGVVHRDIKPGNLMLDQAGRLKVVDFGIAQLIQSGAARLTAIDTTIGSAAYMAPEQARGEPASEATDVYALGCVLMTLLTGQPPFVAEHPMAVVGQHLNATAPRVRERRPEVPAALDRLVADMLMKDRTDRPSDADLLAALDELAQGTSGDTAVLTTPTVVVPLVGGDLSTPPSGMPTSTETPGRSRVGWLVVGVTRRRRRTGLADRFAGRQRRLDRRRRFCGWWGSAVRADRRAADAQSPDGETPHNGAAAQRGHSSPLRRGCRPPNHRRIIGRRRPCVRQGAQGPRQGRSVLRR